MLSAVSTGSAPKALGPYSQAIRAGQFLFVSGQVPIDPATGELVQGSIADQTRRVLQNIGEILAAGGASFQQVVRTTVYLADLVRLRRHERGLRDVLHAAAARAIDHPGRAPAERRPHRSRRHRVPRLISLSHRGTEVTEARILFSRRILCVSASLRWDRDFQVRAAERSTSSTPSTPRSSLITFSRCFTSLISTAMLMRPR